ncbi:MAG: hypothetical protein M1839_000014 [Geoglossum umbratile]|nr:MAG: hypothetical protein M1839_000014 [Geoglossum umbratile]
MTTFFGPELPPEMKRARMEANKPIPILREVKSFVDQLGQTHERVQEIFSLEEFKNSEEGKGYIWESDEKNNAGNAKPHRTGSEPEWFPEWLERSLDVADALNDNPEALVILPMHPCNDDEVPQFLDRLTQIQDSLRVSRDNLKGSPLLRLPRETRYQIYSYVLEAAFPIEVRIPFRRARDVPLDGKQDHNGKGKLRDTSGLEYLPENSVVQGDESRGQGGGGDYGGDDGGDDEMAPDHYAPHPYTPHPSSRRNPLELFDAIDAVVKSSLTMGLFTTSRRISAESLSYFYSHNTFSIPGIICPNPLIECLPTLIGEHNFDCIRKLQYHVHLYDRRISLSPQSHRYLGIRWHQILGRAGDSMKVLKRYLPERLGVDMVLLLASGETYERFSDAKREELSHAIREGYPAAKVEWRVDALELSRSWALTEEPLAMMVYISARAALGKLASE